MRRLTKVALALCLLTGVAHAGAKTDAYRNALMDKFFRASAISWPSTLAVRLYSVCPTVSTSGTEVGAGIGYTAPAANPGAGTWAASASGLTSNVSALSFGKATSNWTVNCIGLESGGTIYYWGPVTGAPVTVYAGETPRFGAGVLTIAEQNEP